MVKYIDMKRTLAVVALFGAFASLAQTRELTVEPGGLGPAAALSQIKAWRAAKDMSPVTVRVRKGVYRLAAPLVFNLPRTDSDITWEGEDGVVFSGGWKLGPWRERDGVLVAKVPAGRWFEQLFVNGRRAERSRYPNEGWLAPSSPTQAYLPSGRCADTLTFTNAEIRAGLKSLSPDELRGAQLRIVHKWATGRYVLGGYDSELGTLTVFGSRWPGWKQWNEKETRCVLENVRFGFDAPGEWFLDGAAGEVLYRPLPGETAANLEAIAPCDGLSTIVRLEGEKAWNVAISNVVFRNIVFAHTAGTPSADSPTGRGPSECDMLQAASTSDGAIELSYVKGVVFDRCRVEHTGNHGMRWRDGCVRNKVRRCTFSDCGAGGIWMGMDTPAVAAGEELTRRMITTPMRGQTAFNEISDCLFTGGGRFNMEGVGVCLTHCSDTKVVHNEIRDNFYSGMSVGWTWGYKGSIAQRNEIAYNRIHDIGKGVMSDMGGIYLLGTAFGTKVHHNVVHDVSGLTYGGWGIYLDEGSEGVTVSDNLTYDTMDGGMNQHYGVGCVVCNNIFGPNRTKGVFNTARQEAQGVPSTIDFIGNICYTEEGPLFAKDSDGVLGARDLNLVYRTDGKGDLGGKDFAAWQASGRGKGNVYADPLFVDAAKRDFRLRPESPAFKLGFRALDLSSVGPRPAGCWD